jgi:phosphatidylserine/phosphatidylglycerophosphate/cardiolipin synthase-like enzyme
MKKLTYIIILGILISCQTPMPKRRPSSEINTFLNPHTIERIYALEMQLSKLKISEKELSIILEKERENETLKYTQDLRVLEKLQAKIKEVESDKSSLTNDLEIGFERTGETLPYSVPANFKNNWRVQKEKLVIFNPENYKLLDGKIVREYTMNMADTKEYQLGIYHKPSMSDFLNNRFKAQVTCNAPFEVKQDLFFYKIGNGKKANFEIIEQKGRSPKVTLRLNQNINKCELLFTRISNPEQKYGIRLVPESNYETKISVLRNKIDTCFLPSNANLKGIEKFFLTTDYQSMTCAMDIKNTDIRTLEDPLTGLKVKAEVLLGMPLPKNMLLEKNPFLELDFSHAPHLDTILISYLVFRADFYGNIIARLLKWHADHGAQVRILVSDVITLDKDHKLLYGLQESSNNIKLQEYRYEASKNGGGLSDLFSEYHRTMHVKLLITLGVKEEDNLVFFGGRNIHDGFVFKEAPNYSAFPNMVQYGSEKNSDESYAHWRDFEVRINSKLLAEKIASHYLTLWERDSQNFSMRSLNQNININKYVDENYFENIDVSLIRHLVSIPYKDDESLERFYVNLFDSAEESLRLSTPYFHLTKPLADAIDRAVTRGVKVSVITRIDLKGDTASIILSEVNKNAINKFMNKVKIFEYTVPSEILHSKIVLIDNKFSFIGSVNLNKRSFVHDMENGIMIYNKAYNAKMNKIMDTYQENSREVSEKQKLSLWKEIVVGLFTNEF